MQTKKNMTKNIIPLLFIFTMIFTACSPYSNLTPMDSMREDLQYPFDVKYADISGNQSVAYVDEGRGSETIIFIHGLGTYLRAWEKNIAELKSDYRCIAIDLPGYGKSTKLPHDGSMTFYADVVMEVMNHLNIESAILAGHSMGGQISMVAALRYPQRVEKLILAAPAGFERFTEGQKEWFREVMSLSGVKKTTAEAIMTNAAYNFYNMPDDAEFIITDRLAMRSANDFDHYCYTVAQSVDGMVNEPVIDKLDMIKQPTLIVFGENDNLIPNRYLNPGWTKDIAMVGHNRIPDSKLIMLPKCGHFLPFEKANEFNSAIRQFLSN
ncbi:4,5:9,10-diseco-3-hydroxy-5,9,17-trioxoandrosta-1(10),2-diene-4-oate hydrolase [Salinivirga cyanobacteriivorans]|uniref:4,5:9,10-diseco-3-hydroxy-5,9, 17-trioxoandrosta-1(10),2-diene-4-oate hydrolase n=1 Tax=Salinivirga cyanobacteriivorans TaxID=1307839 RepID=A0A0S2I4E1_9BACT|nr:alpha/beta hydrolase [Salinivirga cyanobacteriivorans]ALO17037.1 4,5:9,10-diseco-3-hydroxy-5,9,17-trioxoandrosta-1(10),2-diene-4-oate hydrolase [Salinivirga cyanobacteriivorans]